MKNVFLVFAVLISIVCFNAQTKAQDECVRSVPSAILKKNVFPQKTFSLVKNKENPSERIGYEKVVLNKNTKLTVINRGCENYTLIFRFETGGFTHSLTDEKFWFGKAIALMQEVKKGIRAQDLSLINRGTSALRTRINKKRGLKFDEYIQFGGEEIKDMVAVNPPKKQGRGKYKIEIVYSIGPL